MLEDGCGDMGTTDRRWLGLLYAVFGCLAFLIFGFVLTDNYIVGDSQYMLWRDARLELWAGGVVGAATRWQAILSLTFLSAAAACFAVLVHLRSSVSRRVLVIGAACAAVGTILLAVLLAPPSPYQRH